MPEVTSYSTGQPTWADVTSPDVDAAARFYSELFGWEAERDPRPEAGGYTMFRRNGKNVAAATPPMNDAIPPHWTVYLAADDVDAIAAAIRDAGGNVMMDPFDVFDAGRMTVASDPTGAVFGVWQAGVHRGAELRGEPGTLNWAEVQTKDQAAAQSFYERVFGYGIDTMEMGPAGTYVILKVDDQAAAGLVQMGDDSADVPSNWSVVFEVDDTDATVAKLQELGGKLIHGPQDIPDIGRFAVVQDPWGAFFQVIK